MLSINRTWHQTHDLETLPGEQVCIRHLTADDFDAQPPTDDQEAGWFWAERFLADEKGLRQVRTAADRARLRKMPPQVVAEIVTLGMQQNGFTRSAEERRAAAKKGGRRRTARS